MRSPGGDSARPFGPVDFGLVLLGYRILAGKCILNTLAKRPYQTQETNNLQLFGLLKSMRSPGGDSARPFGPVDFGLVLLGYRILAEKCVLAKKALSDPRDE